MLKILACTEGRRVSVHWLELYLYLLSFSIGPCCMKIPFHGCDFPCLYRDGPEPNRIKVDNLHMPLDPESGLGNGVGTPWP